MIKFWFGTDVWTCIFLGFSDGDDNVFWDSVSIDVNGRFRVWYRHMNAYIFGIQSLLMMMMMMIELSFGTDIWTRIFWDSVIIDDDDDDDRIIVWYRCMNAYIFGIQWLLIKIVDLEFGTDVWTNIFLGFSDYW